MSTLRRPGWLFPVCRYTADHLVDLGIRRQRIRVIHNGVDCERFRPDAGRSAPVSPATGPRVLFVGRFTMVKGIGTLIGAIPKIVREVPDVRFQFTGKTPPQLEEWFAPSAELRAHLEFLGYVPDEALPTLYAQATVAVAPSLYDSFPFSVLEAMASGAPIAASAVGGIPEAISDDEEGLLVEPGSAEQLARAVVRLLRDPALRARVGARARLRAETEFTWPKTARATLDGYRQALDTSPGRTKAGTAPGEPRSPV